MDARRWATVAVAVAAMLFVARERGVVDLSVYEAESQIRVTSTAMGDEGRAAAKTLETPDIPLSPLDYVPLYKSRTIQGTVSTAGETYTMDYRIELTAIGLISAREFREVARERLEKQRSN